jgi:hypothetical protein
VDFDTVIGLFEIFASILGDGWLLIVLLYFVAAASTLKKILDQAKDYPGTPHDRVLG